MPPAPSPFPLTQHIQQQQPQPQQQMPPQQQQPSQQQQPFYPALHLYPLNDTFVPKQISLAPQHGRVKIGRQTNAKTVPGERNGYFDSKVLSRQHAEVWEEGGKIYIKDVKSSNGTFINNERLSPEGVESEPYELKTEDTVEFGIDIVGEDNKTIIHHKVAAKVVCILTPEDLQNLAMHPPPHLQNRRSLPGPGQANHIAGNAVLGGMGGPGPRGLRTNGLTFDHILNRLQSEISKSRDTGAELNQLTGVMTEIQDTLGGNLPPNLPPFPANLPPVRPHPVSEPQPPPPTATAPPPAPNASLANLEVQLHETQSSLAMHLDKIRQLEGVLAEHEAVKRDVTLMKDQMEDRRREVEMLVLQRQAEQSRYSGSRKGVNGILDDHSDMDDDDDARSVSTAVPDREDEGLIDEVEEQRRRQREAEGRLRPRTPEPHGLDDEFDDDKRQRGLTAADEAKGASSLAVAPLIAPTAPAAPAPPAFDLSELFSQNASLVSKLEALTNQLDSAMELSKSLQSQATLAQGTIAVLEAKVGSLEALVDEQKKVQVELLEKQREESLASSSKAAAEPTAPVEPSIAQSKWDEWKEKVEGTWHSQRETWESERKRLAGAVQEWERRTSALEQKEEDRRQREVAAEEREALQRQRLGPGFGGSDDSDEDLDDGNHTPEEDVFGLDAPNGIQSKPKMPNGILSPTKKSVNGKSRRKHRSSSKTNGKPNGILPSPVASPTSSNSSYASHRRDGSSPTRGLEPVSLNHLGHHLNGKLPLSPPNTSPRSRAESLPLDVDDDADLSVKDITPVPSDCVTDSAQSLGKLSGHTTQLTDLPMPYLSAAGMVVIGLAAYAVMNRIKD